MPKYEVRKPREILTPDRVLEHIKAHFPSEQFMVRDLGKAMKMEDHTPISPAIGKLHKRGDLELDGYVYEKRGNNYAQVRVWRLSTS